MNHLQPNPGAHLPVFPEELVDRDLRGPATPTRKRLWVLTGFFMAAVFVVTVIIDRFLRDYNVTWRYTLEFSDFLGAVFAGALFHRILQYERERRSWLRQRIEVIAEINHYVRNGLQAITLSTHSTGDKIQIEAVREGMNRIQYALKEILPKLQ